MTPATKAAAEHSRMAPSASYRWLRCAGSAVVEDEDGDICEQAVLGTFTHNYIADNDSVDPDALDADDREIFDRCVEAWEDFATLFSMEPGREYVEHRIASQEIPSLWGTIDRLKVSGDTIHVADLKTGLLGVSAYANTQLGCYLLLAQEAFPGRKKFFGSIVQPQLDYVETVEYTAAQLQILREKVKACEHSDSRTAGTWCEYCPLLATCQTARETMLDLVDDNSPDNIWDEIEDLPEDLADDKRIVDFAKVFENLEKVSRQKLLAHIEDGGKVPGYKAANYRPPRTWSDPEAAVDVLREVCGGDDQILDVKLKTVTQIEKLGITIPEDLVFIRDSRRILSKSNSPRPEATIANGDEFK